MSNRAHVEPTKFRDIRTSHTTFGFRIWDDNYQGYNNKLSAADIQDDLGLLKLILSNLTVVPFDPCSEILSTVRDEQTGIFVGATYYPWVMIEHLFADEAQPGHSTSEPGPSDSPTLIGTDTEGPGGSQQGGTPV